MEISRYTLREMEALYMCPVFDKSPLFLFVRRVAVMTQALAPDGFEDFLSFLVTCRATSRKRTKVTIQGSILTKRSKQKTEYRYRKLYSLKRKFSGLERQVFLRLTSPQWVKLVVSTDGGFSHLVDLCHWESPELPPLSESSIATHPEMPLTLSRPGEYYVRRLYEAMGDLARDVTVFRFVELAASAGLVSMAVSEGGFRFASAAVVTPRLSFFRSNV